MCVDGKISGLDHVQLAMPRGGEKRARAYFGGLLGLVELEKPAALAGRGVVRAAGWAADPSRGRGAVQAEREGASGVRVHGAGRARTLGEVGYTVRWDGELAPRRRFYAEDPFGNRIEFIEP